MKYDEAIEEFIELTNIDPTVKDKINPYVINVYCLKAKGKKDNGEDNTDTLKSAFEFMKNLDKNVLKLRISDTDYVLEHLAKNLVLEGKDIDEIQDVYKNVHDSNDKSLIKTLYGDAWNSYNDGKASSDKGLLKEAVAYLFAINNKFKLHGAEINDALMSLVNDYGTEYSKSNYDDLVLAGHTFDIDDFDF